MIRCENCGAFLHEGEKNACFVCGKVNNASVNNSNANSSIHDENKNDNMYQAGGNSMQNTYNSSAVGQNEASRMQAEQMQQSKTQYNNINKENSHAQNKRTLNINEQTYENNYEKNYENSYDEKFKQLEKRSKKVETKRSKKVETKRSKKPKLITWLAIILTLMVVLLVAGSVTSVIMYDSFNKAQGYTQIKTALINADIETLSQLVQSDTIEVTEAGLNALCRQFSTEQKVDELFLALDSRDENTESTDEYSAISVISDGVFLGYSEYKLQVDAVEMVFAVESESAVVSMDGVPIEGQEVDGTIKYSNIFPGRYTVIATAQTIAGQSVQGEATEIALLNSNQPYSFDGALPITDITVSGCVSDEAVIYVNDVQVQQKPQDKKVSLSQVLVGSNIKAVITTQNGATATSTIQFTDKAVTELAFIDYEFSGGDLPIETLDEAFLGFYTSYVEAKNSHDVNKLVNVTDIYKEFLAAEFAPEVEKLYDIELTSTAVSGIKIKQYFNDAGEHCLIVNAQADYKRTPVEEKADTESVTEYITIQMVYSNTGSWIVSRIAPNDVDNHNAGTFSPDISV